MSDIATYFGLLQESRLITREANPYDLIRHFKHHDLPFTHENKSIRNLSKFVDIKLRVFILFAFHGRRRIDGFTYEPTLEHAILDSTESFNQESLDLITNRFVNNSFFNAPIRYPSATGVFIADRLVDFIGGPATTYLDAIFKACDDRQFLEFCADSSFHKHDSAKAKILDKIEQRTLGRNNPLEFPHVWQNAVKLIPTLGEPARTFLIDTCADVFDRQLAYHAVKTAISLDPAIAVRCQELVTDRLNSDGFSTGADNRFIVQCLARTHLFQEPANAYLERHPEIEDHDNLTVIFSAPDEMSELRAFNEDIDRLNRLG